MTKAAKSAAKISAEQAVKDALASQPQATAADVAAAAGVGRSTAGKLLARLATSGEVRRTEGGRHGARRLPACFSLASTQPMPAYSEATRAEPAPNGADDNDASVAASAEPEAADAKPEVTADRLRPGQLDGLVLGFLDANVDSGPHGATTVARALKRSSGAVSNCLIRLTNAKRVRQDSEKPRRYSAA